KDLAATTAHNADQIAQTIADLQHHAADVSSTLTLMSSGIVGINEASGTLRQVAVDQRAVVAQLDSAMSDAIDKVEEISAVTATLGVRKHEGFPTMDRATVVLAGHSVAAGQTNLGVGGVGLSLPLEVSVGKGDLISVELDLGAGPRATVRCRVAR